jgi:carbon-monoxide dehydrogenase small subunit
MILAGVQLLERNAKPSREEICKGLDGNLCRCTGYHNIVKAIAAGAKAMKG